MGAGIDTGAVHDRPTDAEVRAMISYCLHQISGGMGGVPLNPKHQQMIEFAGRVGVMYALAWVAGVEIPGGPNPVRELMAEAKQIQSRRRKSKREPN